MVTYSCDAVSTGSGEFVGYAILSVTCRDDGLLPQCFNMHETTLSFFAVVRDAITASSLAGTVITCKTVSRSGTARTSSTSAALACFQERPVKLVVVFPGHTAGEPVVMYPGVYDHEVPLVMSPVLQATGWRMVLTWVWLHLVLTFAYLGNHINQQTGKQSLSLLLVTVLPRRTVKRQLTVGSLVETPYVVEFVYFSFLVAVLVVTAYAYFNVDQRQAQRGLELRTRVRFHGLGTRTVSVTILTKRGETTEARRLLVCGVSPRQTEKVHKKRGVPGHEPQQATMSMAT